MKYTYHFLNGESQEIEVTEALYMTLTDADRLEYNNDHANTRRHISMDMAESDEGMQFADPASLPMSETDERVQMALEHLRPDQQRLIHAVYFDGMSVNDFADIEGVTKSAISHRLSTAEKNLRKILSNPQL